MTKLETVSVTVPEHALEPFEAALSLACHTVGLFLTDEAHRIWTVEGVRAPGHAEAQLQSGLLLANLLTGEAPVLARRPTEVGGWLARTQSSFPEQRVGRRFAIRGTHLPPRRVPGRLTLVLDAGVAFGSGEHNSTRGCLRALERVAHRRPRRILDLGCGSAILAMAAARLLHRPVLATDIDAWSVRVAAENARLNGLGGQVHCQVAAGWQPVVCAGGAIRPGVRQHPRPPALCHGRGFGRPSGAGWHGDPGRAARLADPYGACGPPAERPGRGARDH